VIENRDASERRAVTDKRGSYLIWSMYVAIFAEYCSSVTWSDWNKVENHNEQFYPIFQGRRNTGRAGGSERAEGNENLKNKKIVTNNACFGSATILTSKLIT